MGLELDEDVDTEDIEMATPAMMSLMRISLFHVCLTNTQYIFDYRVVVVIVIVIVVLVVAIAALPPHRAILNINAYGSLASVGPAPLCAFLRPRGLWTAAGAAMASGRRRLSRPS